MAIFRTTDHEEIRKWIEEKGGKPAIIRGVSQEDGEGLLTIMFNVGGAGTQEIGWTEFLDTFEDHQLRFRYEDPAPKDEAAWDFAFEGRDEPTDDTDDETQLPEDIDDIEENMFPSAPADGADDM